MVAGCGDGVVGMWQVIMDEDRCQVRLHWKTTNGKFSAEDAIVQDVQGLSPLNERILMTRVVPEEDGESEESYEGDEYEESEESEKDEEDEENDDGGEVFIQRASLSPFEGLTKRPFDGEDRDVAKRMRGNEGGSSMEE